MGCERQVAAGVAHPAKAAHRRDPRSRDRGDVDSVAGVVLQVLEVQEGGLGEVVIGEVQVTDLSGDHRLHAGRQ